LAENLCPTPRRQAGAGGVETVNLLDFLYKTYYIIIYKLLRSGKMTEAVREELDRIVNALVETGIVTKIILFGSHARGEETPESDIDLCVLTPVKDEGRLLTKTSIDLRVKISDVQESALDLLTYNQDDFAVRAKSPKSFQRHIADHGVVLYG
jgi:predicted nucleotidyltransferase